MGLEDFGLKVVEKGEGVEFVVVGDGGEEVREG